MFIYLTKTKTSVAINAFITEQNYAASEQNPAIVIYPTKSICGGTWVVSLGGREVGPLQYT